MSTLKVNAIQSNTTQSINVNSNLGNISNIEVAGVGTFSGGVVISSGSTSAPSISPRGDSNTGIFFPSPDTIAFAEGGVEALRINSSANIGIGTNNLSSKLQVQGTIGLGASDDPEVSFPGGRTKLTSSASGFIINHNDNSSFIFQNQATERARLTTSGNLGIGTNNPYAKTHIEINAVAGAGSGNAAALWLKNANQTANNSATIFAGNDSSAACAAINFVHANYSNNQGFISFDTRENASTYNANAFRIDAYGRVTSPYQPRFHAVKTTSQTATTSNTKVQYDAAAYNVGGHYSDANERFTSPVTGYYYVYAAVNILASANSTNFQLFKNGSLYQQCYFNVINHPRQHFIVSGVVYLEVNDFIEIYANTNTGTITLDNAGYFGASLLG
jgi:hypothetical protein